MSTNVTELPTRRTTLPLALLPILTMLVGFVAGDALLPVGDARHGSAGNALLVCVLLLAALVAGFVARHTGHTWEAIQAAAAEKLASVFPMILILLAIGMLIGTWIFAGTIPYLVYWGVRLVDPEHLLVTAFVVTSIMSLATGTSWGSAGTIGVALVGVAVALDGPVAATAGAVVSGAYFGDKMSPLSDMTNICALGAGAKLYDHIRHMLYTAVPSVVVALAVYTVAGMTMHDSASGSEMPASAVALLDELRAIFNLSPLVLIPVVVVLVGIVRGASPSLTMAASSVVAMVLGIVMQGMSFEGSLVSAFAGFDLSLVPAERVPETGFSGAVTTLLVRGGLNSMSGTLLIIIAAFLLAGAMHVSGSLETLIRAMLSRVQSVFGLILATLASGMVMIGLTSHGGVTALVVGGLYQQAYRDRKLAPANLSRTLEDSVTIVEPLMPWTVSAAFMAKALGVSTLDYLPWATFCFTGPIFTLAYGAIQKWTHFGIKCLADTTQATATNP
ncbi:MAG: Na+/H+ antiporter NhaC [Phycisphaerales bacterium]|nr:Na+/H+ antiporter NhaC [Phycisphaerales bacterium]